jgi:tetratricopeptide (TPR) repeat protein
MAWGLEHAQLVAERDAANERVQQRPGLASNQRLGRAHRWLDEEDQARRAFAGGAEHFRTRVLAEGRGDSAGAMTEYGHLLRGAGDLDAARDAYTRALERLDEHMQPDLGEELRYLLGQDPGGDDLLKQLARGDAEPARAAVVRALKAERVLPSYTAPRLTLYDLLEETYRVDSERTGRPLPPHLDMLCDTGLLLDAPPAPASPKSPPPVGRWTVDRDGFEASIEQPEIGPIKAVLSPRVWLELQPTGQREDYLLRVYDDSGRIAETGPYANFGEAVEGTLDVLPSVAPDTLETFRALVRSY